MNCQREVGKIWKSIFGKSVQSDDDSNAATVADKVMDAAICSKLWSCILEKTIKKQLNFDSTEDESERVPDASLLHHIIKAHVAPDL